MAVLVLGTGSGGQGKSGVVVILKMIIEASIEIKIRIVATAAFTISTFSSRNLWYHEHCSWCGDILIIGSRFSNCLVRPMFHCCVDATAAALGWVTWVVPPSGVSGNW